ncbi:unnamed protein product [Phytophthora fragariaefolia]|uniref:Unnamed protein product n=1 Tax=Phytophthora fragariaefolia TaxID=1490495 RepID=A0A9W6TS28_9STRA|nr:unnamed protein product [Phytophthora fragariaefolia]
MFKNLKAVELLFRHFAIPPFRHALIADNWQLSMIDGQEEPEFENKPVASTLAALAKGKTNSSDVNKLMGSSSGIPTDAEMPPVSPARYESCLQLVEEYCNTSHLQTAI